MSGLSLTLLTESAPQQLSAVLQHGIGGPDARYARSCGRIFAADDDRSSLLWSALDNAKRFVEDRDAMPDTFVLTAGSG